MTAGLVDWREHLPAGVAADLSPAGEGDFCVAFRGGGRIVRVAKHAEAAEALRREACVMDAVAARLPLPVPRPVFSEPEPGCAFSIHPEITGEELTREMWERLPDRHQETTAADLARFLDALHAIELPDGADCGLPRLDLAAFASRVRDTCHPLYPLLPDDIARRLRAGLACWSEPAAGGAEHPASLLHRDVAPGHVLFDPATGRLTGIIDFGDLALGDRARDFIYVYEDFGPQMLAAVLRHYAAEDAATLLPRIHAWFLVETVAWTAGQHAEGEAEDVEEGIAIIRHELDALGI